MELLIGLFVIYVIYSIFKKPSSEKILKSKPNITINIDASNYDDNTFESYAKPKGKPAKWFAKSSSVNIQSYNINDGMLYVGESLPDMYGYNNDACLVNPALKILPSKPWEHGDEMGYWPSYSDISPRCRGAYLEWLSAGRSEPETHIGYVFLFFYGLERRLFCDGQKDGISKSERLDVINEVRRLLSIYGENRSFQGYARNLLTMEWALYQNSEAIPTYIDLSSRHSQAAFQVVLAQYVVAGKAISADIALTWFTLHPNFGVRTAARRCPEEFKALFTQYYEQKFGEGLIVKPNKTLLKLSYYPANSSLRGVSDFKVQNLPDPFILTGALKKIDKIVEKCTIALDPYSRHIGRVGNSLDSLNALSLLPPELIKQSSATIKVVNHLNRNFLTDPQILSVDELYGLFSETTPVKITKKDSESLAKLFEGMGFGLIPDSRFYNIKPTSEGKVVVFPKGHGVDFQPSREFHTMSSILRLGAIVSQIDDDVSSAEEEALKSLIRDNRELTNIEKDSLEAFLFWSLKTPQSITGLKQKLTAISKEEKIAIGHILISIANADGYIDNKEVKQIEKLYTTLGLDKAQVSSDIHQLISGNELVTVALQSEKESFSIPGPARVNTNAFSLNEEIIKIREMETQQVKSVLEEIFDNEDEIEEKNDVLVTSDPLLSLDQMYQNLLNTLLTKETWEKDALREVCKKLDLMVDGALELLNEWAYEHANAPLIEDGELVYIDLELAKEILGD
ncbi:MAG: TerB N-terminal domain-containing protein [Pseudomonadota bacterium]